METRRKKIIMFSAISLTDIVLLLLIFFLLSSSFIVQPGIKVTLPKAVSADVDSSDRIFVTVTENQVIYLNQKQVLKSELGVELRELLSEKPERLVVIQADKDISLENTIEVIDIAKLAGAERFMIATKKGIL
ncbi:biopolymer transporter ExbD [candidate division KSB1 bacterium]|nr:biopolymer transporter ExbD [candidate division KSB1 bacterium]